jgi:hypothetical protein
MVVYSRPGFTQGWVQTSATPIGGGVTDLLVRENGDILATVGSFNWPGVAGGVRKSTDEGQTWQNVASAFNGRTIEEAFDGNLYASIWFYPQNEGLYRSTNGGDSWTGPIYSVPSGNNIFSIAVKPGSPNYSIFAGTRNGVMRSTDSGASFQSSNNGIPANSWVRDLEIDTSGIIAAATTNGVFISTNNGDTWETTTGLSASDTTVTLIYEYDIGNSDFNFPKLFVGTAGGSLYESFQENLYLSWTLAAIFDDGELAGLAIIYLTDQNIKMHGVAVFNKGVYTSTDPQQGFNQQNEGLPQNPKVSAISGEAIQPRTGEAAEMYVGLYENTSTGAKIYKRTFVVGVENISSENPTEYKLEQNYPNPFNPITTIQFSIPEREFVRLEIFNSLGEKVSTLVSEELNAGSYKFDWNAESFSSGIYYYALAAGGFSKTRKLVLLK